MPSRSHRLSDKAALPFKTGNKLKRQRLHIKQKQARDSLRREERFGRKKEESKNPRLREERLRRNVPQTLDTKRVWDDVEGDDEDGGLGLSFDVEQRVKRRRLEEEQAPPDEVEDDDEDSMLDESSSEEDEGEYNVEEEEELNPLPTSSQLRSSSSSKTKLRGLSPTRSTTSIKTTTTAATNLALAPEALTRKFPSLFPTEPPPPPKILITTSLTSICHTEAQMLTSLFPNSTYIPRVAPRRHSAHHHSNSYRFSLREISTFAARRGYTAVVLLTGSSISKAAAPTALTIVHLPTGPTFYFSINTWIPGHLIPGHGKAPPASASALIPELILNNFRTPLGLLTAHLFRSLFPHDPTIQARTVVTLHNARDYIFLRRHRYIFREKRETEKSVVGSDGREMKGVEGIRAGLQELGPRVTLKLRKVEQGLQSGKGPIGGATVEAGGMNVETEIAPEEDGDDTHETDDRSDPVHGESSTAASRLPAEQAQANPERPAKTKTQTKKKAESVDSPVIWQWKGRMEKVRTKFQL